MADFDGSHFDKQVPLKEAADLSKPMRGCVICCTSVPDEKRTEMAQFAEQMGGLNSNDLTSDVTHLIVADYNTRKYQFVARERPDVQPMTMEWISALRDLWINDQEIDFAALETRHRLPVFDGLRFSMTGCDDPAERHEISEKVIANGATYEGDLTKRITHLISFRTEGAKYKAAKSWGLKIVSVEWLRDSLERGMILEEKLYDPLLPLDQRGKGAWDRTKPTRSALGKRSRESSENAEGGKRKLRRTASARLMSQNENLWGDITRGSTVMQVERSGVWDNVEEAKRPTSRNSNNKTLLGLINGSSMQSTIANEPIQQMFTGCRFYLYGFVPQREAVLRDHLSSNGAEISGSIESLIDIPPPTNIKRIFRVVPHNMAIKDFPELPSSQPVIETVTYWWLERCLHGRKFIEPSECIIGRPFPVFPITAFKDCIVSSAAFSGIELLHMTRAVGLIGATYSEDMTPQSTVLVTKCLTALRKDKSEYSRAWNVPVVQADWLWDSIAAGERLPLTKYKIRPKRSRTGSLEPAAVAKEGSGVARSKSDTLKSVSTSNEHSSSNTRAPQGSKLDTTAFEQGKSKSTTKPSRRSQLDDTAFTKEENAVIAKPSLKTKADGPDTTAFETSEVAQDAKEPAQEQEPVDENMTMEHDEPNITDDHIQDGPGEAEITHAESNEAATVKDEQVSQAPFCPPPVSPSTQDRSSKSIPLSERSINSPTKTNIPLPPEPAARPDERISSAISDLLAKSKTKTAVQPSSKDSSEGRKRGGNRIFGRVRSNVSTGSNNNENSRSGSVDSNISHTNSMAAPTANMTHSSRLSSKSSSGQGQIDMLVNVNGNRQVTQELESQMPATQLEYDDPESTTAREIVMARMNGEKIDVKKIAAKSKERTPTITMADIKAKEARKERGVVRGRSTRSAARDGLR